MHTDPSRTIVPETVDSPGSLEPPPSATYNPDQDILSQLSLKRPNIIFLKKPIMTEDNTHPAQRQLASPNRITKLFHHHSWQEPWPSQDFPPDEQRNERESRFKSKPWWPHLRGGSAAQMFNERYALHPHTWPWGFVIYRTTYSSTTDEDWAAVLAKLDRYNCWRGPIQDEPSRIVKEGYRNLIAEDPELEGASLVVIVKRHTDFLKQCNLTPEHQYPRSMYCLMLDERSVQSILLGGEPEPHGPGGYVNVLDMSRFLEECEDVDPDSFYDGCVRLDLGGLRALADRCDHRPLSDLYDCVTGPGMVPYTDGYDYFCIAPRSILVHEPDPMAGLFGFKPKPWLSRPV